MTNVTLGAQDSMITASTVDEVGICYFDPFTEELLELNSANGHFLSVSPMQKIIRKYYLIVSPGETFAYVKIKLINSQNIENLYSAKVIISEIQPTINSFDVLPDFNAYKISSPMAGHLIPVWILLNSKSPINDIVKVDIKVDYE
jgi:hypothetical protein